MSAKASSARDEAREELVEGMRESFGKLAQTAVAKSDTLNAHSATIAAQAKTTAELTATNTILVAALAAKAKAPRTVTPPPGFTANAMGHTVNTTGVACSTRTSKLRNTVFVVPKTIPSAARTSTTSQRIGWRRPKTQCSKQK